MSESTRMWRADEQRQEPVLVDCPNGLYPEKDSDGYTIYENTHFEAQGDAWKKLLSESEAWILMSGRNIQALEKKLHEAQKDAAAATKMYAAVRQKLSKERTGN